MRSPSTSAVVVGALVLVVAALAAAGPIIQPRPVDNRRDPHDGEPFEWEPVDDDPWPGPSFTFPQLPGIDELDKRPASLPEAQVRAALLMQLLRSIFNNNFNNNNYNNVNRNRPSAGNKPVSSNEVGFAASRQQQKRNKQKGRRGAQDKS